MSLLWATDSVATPLDGRRMPVIGDIDLDGVPEVVTGVPGLANRSYVYNGANGVLERTLATLPISTSSAYAIADIDNDGFGEIVMVTSGSRQLICYEHNGAIKWTSAVAVGYAAADDSWTPAVADFEEDGVPEIYIGNQIFNSVNGNLIVGGGPANGKGLNNGSPNEPFSVAADVLPNGFCPDCNGLELVAGNTVYSVNLGAGTMTVRVSPTGSLDGMTSLGDIDRDGDLDAVVVAQNLAGRGVVYGWDLQSNTVIGTPFQIDGVSTAGGAITTSGGLATIADVDNNGVMDVVVAGRNVIVCLQYNAGPNTFTEKWSAGMTSLSGRLGTTLFDFEGDGVMELVFRDELQLYVLNAATGIVRFQTSCPSQTRLETPVIADVDNNGQANIVCGCGTKVRAYQPTAVPWVATRTVFNQRSYFVLNIKDNLRVPRVQQRQQLGFPAGSPTNFPFNAFMKQTPKLADNGALVNPAANDAVTILNPLNDIDLGSCQNGVRDSVGVRLTVTNTGSSNIPAGTRIAFYNGNPYLPGATFMQANTITTSVPAGSSLTMPMIYVGDQGGTFNLYYQINDNGTNGIPLTGPAFGHQECNFGNNIGNYQITNCGNLPPVIDTSGLATGTIVLTSLEDQVVTYCISASDPQFDAHDATAIIGAPTLGTVSGLNDGDSCITLTPTLNASGTTTFSIIVCDDANVSLCDTVVFIWNITAVNDAPVAVDDTATTNEDTPVSLNILTNDFDVESNPLTVTITGGPSNGSQTFAAGVVTYTPAPNFFGIDTISYQLCDNALPPGCDNALIIINVVPVNDAPLALDDSLTMPNDTVLVNIVVQANDTDIEAGSLFTVSILCPPTQGIATVSSGSIVYIPDSTYLGPDSLCYVLCDDGIPSMCDTAYVYFNIFNGNDAPIALDDQDSTTYLDPVSFPILLNDSDPNGHTFDITMIGCGPLHGTVLLDTALGMVIYTPDTLFLGTDTFCYVICDNPPAGVPFCDTAYVSVYVETDNNAPQALCDTMTVLFNTPGTRNILTNDSDPDTVDAIIASLIMQPSNGTMLLSGGLATYTPNATYVGVDTAWYALCDNGYTPLCDTACIVFTVLPPNDLIVPNGFSPNGDGANDFLEIEAILLFPNNELQIFNRWGSKVFEAQGYRNEWDGSFNGNPVPDGTYFYTLDPGDGTAVVTGFILVYR
jgi:gliding motility-associated-like protein